MNNVLQNASARQRLTGLLPVLTVLLSAFLLFVLELAAAKALLPRFGGSPMVWTTSMLAYQVLLFAGYGCAHRQASCRSGRLPTLIYISLVAVAATVAWFRLRVDVLGGGDAAAISRQPVQDLLLTMMGTLALPFVAVSATSPLVQHWQQRMDAGRSSYWLYAVSNIGSFAGLLAYPFLIEPFLSVDLQFFFTSIP